MPEYLLLVLAWIVFGVVHSLTAASFVKQRIMRLSGWVARYYRLMYNALSLLTFLPVILTYWLAPVQIIGEWEGPIYLGTALVGLGTVLSLFALIGYDLVEFTGLPLRRPDQAANETLKQQGSLRYVRHPLYLGTLVILIGLFFREPSWRSLLFSGFGFLYLRIGIYFEEQKLVRVFGQSYRDYQRRVPMLMPFAIRRN